MYYSGDDWPGFGVPLTRNESLWDSEYNPLDPNNTWAVAPETPPAPDVSLYNNIYMLHKE